MTRTAKDWADEVIERGNIAGRLQRQRDDPDQDSNPRGTHSHFDKDVSRRIIFHCIKRGNALRKTKASGCCDRCEEAMRRRKIK